MGNIPDWMRCIICYVYARDGKIQHLKTCADYVPVRNILSAKSLTVGDLLRRSR